MRASVVYTRIHRIACIAMILPFMSSCAFSQQPRTAFDYTSTLEFSHRVSLMGRGDMNGDGITDVLAIGSGRLTVAIQGETSFRWKQRTVRAGTKFLAVATGRINADGRDDIALCSSGPSSVSIFLSGTGGQPRFSSTIELGQDAQQVVVADADGDGLSDLLLFGKKALGITVLPGNGKGGFGTGTVLFPEQSVSLVSVLSLDGDDLPDIIAVNWIRNRVEVYTGFGGLNFSEPAVIGFETEPVTISTGDLTGDRVRDLLVGFADPPSYEVFRGDPSGEFTRIDNGSLPGPPARLRIGDIDGDAINDLLLASPSAGIVGVAFGDRPDGFTRVQSYGVGPDAVDALFFRDRRERYLNCAVLAAGRREVLLLHTRTPAPPDRSSYNLVTGVDPADIIIADFNGDGWSDAIVAQRREPLLNLFLNDKNGTLSGFFSRSLSGPASRLIPLDGAGTPGELVGVGMEENAIHCSFIALDGAATDAVRLPGDQPGSVIAAEAHPEGKSRRLYVFRDSEAEKPGNLFAYDISDAGPNEEIELTAPPQGGTLATLVHDFNGDRRLDIVTLSITDTSGAFVLRWYRQDSLRYVPRDSTVFWIPGSFGGRCAMWGHDLNGDGADDLLLNFQKPWNTLFVSLATGDSSFLSPELKLTEIRADDRKHQLIATDFDANGTIDLIMLNERTNTVQFFPGDGMGNFDRPVNLTSGKGVEALAVADLDRNGEMELIVSGENGTGLSVTSFHHPLYRRQGADGKR